MEVPSLHPEAEVRELRALVALLEKERTELVGQLDDLEDELGSEQRRTSGLEAEVTRLRDREMFADSPTVRIDDDEVEMLKQRLDEAFVVREDMEARLATAEEGEAHTMRTLAEKEALFAGKISSLAARLTTVEMECSRLREENQELADELTAKSREEHSDSWYRQQLALMEAKASEADRSRRCAEDELLGLQAEVADLKLQTELRLQDSPASDALRPSASSTGLRGITGALDASVHDPQINAETLLDLDTPQLESLNAQYLSRIRHLTALQRDVQRTLHHVDPTQHPDPDTAAESPVRSRSASGGQDTDEEADKPCVDKEWLELAHWMRGRFGQQTSMRELRAYVERFAPKKLRAPAGMDGGGGAADSPSSSRQGWRQRSFAERSFDGASQPDTTMSLLQDRDMFEKLFHEARQRGRSLYCADRECQSSRPASSYSTTSSPSRSTFSSRYH